MTYGIKGDIVVLVTDENQNDLIGYKFVNELTDEQTLLLEKNCAECCGYSCEIVDGELVKTETAESVQYEMGIKAQRILQIDADVEKLGGVVVNKPKMQAMKDMQIARLTEEKALIEDEIEGYLDRIESTYGEEALEQISIAIFGNLTY